MRIRIEPVGNGPAIELRGVVRLTDITKDPEDSAIEVDFGETGKPEALDPAKDLTVHINPANIVAVIIRPDVAPTDGSC